MSCRQVLMVLAGTDPFTLSIWLPPLPGVCVSGRGDGDCTADGAPNRGSTTQTPTQLWASSASTWGQQVAEAGNKYLRWLQLHLLKLIFENHEQGHQR